MKGLILKDLYMAAKYCRSYVLITLIFGAMSLFGNGNSFFIFYPSILCGMIPVNLIAYDEKSRWSQYCRTMPYKTSQIVGGKYVIGLMAQLAVLVLMCGAQAIKMGVGGNFRWGSLLCLIAFLLCASLTSAGLCMPFIFRFGVEKGRIAYYVVVGIVCALALIFANGAVSDKEINVNIYGLAPAALLAGAVIYALSWLISVRVYKKREI